MGNPTCAEIIRRQSGVISRQQAMAAGLTRRRIDGLLSRGRWTALFPGVYLSADAELNWNAMAHAATLAAGSGATVVAESAAAVRTQIPKAFPVTVAIPAARRCIVRHPKLTLLRLDVPEDETVRVQGLPTTTRLRTAVDLAHLLPLKQAQPIIDRMLVRDEVDLVQLTAAVAPSRRHGSAQARCLIASANDRAAAESERMLRRLLQDAGITGWVSNHELVVRGRKIKVDLALVQYRIGIEVKGWVFHSAGDRAASDDWRVGGMQVTDWIVIPVGWLALMTDPGGVIALVRDAIALRQRQGVA